MRRIAEHPKAQTRAQVGGSMLLRMCILGSGVYVVRMETGDFVYVRKMVLIYGGMNRNAPDRET